MNGDEYKELRQDIKEVVNEMRVGFKTVAEAQSKAALDAQAVGSIFEVQKAKCTAKFDDIHPRLDVVEDEVQRHSGVLYKLHGAVYLLAAFFAILGLAVKAGWL